MDSNTIDQELADASEELQDASEEFFATIEGDPFAIDEDDNGIGDDDDDDSDDGGNGDGGDSEEDNNHAEEGERQRDDEEEDEEDEEDDSRSAEREAEMAEARATLLARGFRLKDAEPPESLLNSFDLQGVAEYIVSKQCRNIVVMCGAGISVSAGIPDFRTPGTGLYDNLQAYDLPSPQSMFELSYFRERPDAFYRLCAELWPDNFAPTPTHHFLTELYTRGLLRRCFTQNIDSLEAAAHMPANMIVAAHGNFDRCSCIDTGEEIDVAEVRAAIAHGKEGERGWKAMAERHGGLVKPDIVFFGEALPERFFDLAQSDFAVCDLLIIMGTSLKVHPFASLVGLVGEDVPRLLVNREVVGTQGQPLLEMLGFVDHRALDFDESSRYRDAVFLGDCDKAVHQLAACLDAVGAASNGVAQRPTDATDAAAASSAGPPTQGSPPAESVSLNDGAPPSSAEGVVPPESWVAALQRRIDSQPPPPSRPPPWISSAKHTSTSEQAAESTAEPTTPPAAEPAAPMPAVDETLEAAPPSTHVCEADGMEKGSGDEASGECAAGGKGASGNWVGVVEAGSAEEVSRAPLPAAVTHEEAGESASPDEPEPKMARLA